MTVQTMALGVASRPVSPAIGLSPELPDIVALRRDRWFDGPETRVSPGENLDQSSSIHDNGPAWQRLTRQRLGIGAALFDVANGLAYAVDAGAWIFLYRVIAARGLQRQLSLAALIASGEVAAARFAANGILEWVPLPGVATGVATGVADVNHVRTEALRLGATPLRRIFTLSPLRTEGGVRMASTSGNDHLTLDLTPPNVGHRHFPQSRRFAWAEQGAPMSYGFGAPAAEQMPVGLVALFSEPWQ